MIKKIVAIVCLIGIAGSTVGCNKNEDPLSKLSKKELIAQCNAQNQQLQDNQVKIEELQTKLKGIQEDQQPTSAIVEIQDGTGRLTFKSDKDNMISFPKPLEYPNASQAPNTSSINIAEHVSIVPTINWIAKLNGTELQLQHDSGITGTIKVGKIDSIVKREELQPLLSEFFSNLPPETIVYSKLFLGDNNWGIEGKAPTKINEKDAYIRCGMLGIGEISFTYAFVYQGKQDNTKDETILTLLKTMKILGQQLRIE